MNAYRIPMPSIFPELVGSDLSTFPGSLLFRNMGRLFDGNGGLFFFSGRMVSFDPFNLLFLADLKGLERDRLYQEQ
tara:strand:+ start:2245 stop:2472 length:228 start_codon:yes stop_codon:yes gene_type:complete